MPLRRAQPPPDLERVARILGGGAGAGEHGGSGVVEGGKGAQEGDRAGLRAGWVPVLPSGAVGPPTPAEQLDTDLRRARRPGVVTTPEPMRLGRWSVSNATVVALIALVVAVACVFAVRVLWAERSAGAAVPVTGEGLATGVIVTGPASSGASSGATAEGSAERSAEGSAVGSAGRPTAGPSPSGAEIVVHVVGQVVRPGLVRLRQGARVADAVAAAGGARSGADLAALNLARLVVDGEQLHVPKPGEVLAPPVAGSGSAGGSGTVGGGGAAGGGGGSGGGPVSLNTADLAALDSLPGVGPVLAQRILDWRAEHGRFTSVDELGEVSGIGDKLLGRLRPQVTL
ncbi:MAG TPA: ComEA family DNA-binding protein [Humibacillus xanthopallidus]|nr:ComEA family DNA-binding protein [Humibacillus xanthopallidus]